MSEMNLPSRRAVSLRMTGGACLLVIVVTCGLIAAFGGTGLSRWILSVSAFFLSVAGFVAGNTSSLADWKKRIARAKRRDPELVIPVNLPPKETVDRRKRQSLLGAFAALIGLTAAVIFAPNWQRAASMALLGVVSAVFCNLAGSISEPVDNS
jgi:MFS family permease